MIAGFVSLSMMKEDDVQKLQLISVLILLFVYLLTGTFMEIKLNSLRQKPSLVLSIKKEELFPWQIMETTCMDLKLVTLCSL